MTTEAGRQLLAEVAVVRSIGPADVERLRKRASPAAVSAAIRLFQARTKASLKFERGQQMWVDPTAIEQATSELVARHKAQPIRLSAGRRSLRGHRRRCAGAGRAVRTSWPSIATRACAVDSRYNASVYERRDRLLPVRARAENLRCRPAPGCISTRTGGCPVKSVHAIARGLRTRARVSGTRRWNESPRGAIKLGPASDFARHFAGARFEVELISLRGECKEATVWFGELVSCGRRADPAAGKCHMDGSRRADRAMGRGGSAGRFVIRS